MTVTRAELEQLLAELVREVTDPRAGIYGPDSVSWEIGKEAVLFVGGGKAALLQLAHPFVAHAVDQHSATRSDPLGRFRRTFDNVFAMFFGDLDQALKSARRVHAIHSRIRGPIAESVGVYKEGDRYEANDEQALLWVHATLVHTSVEVYELVVRPLTLAEKQRYYAESKRFGQLFGIPDRVLPADWHEFDAYYRRMLESDLICVGKPAREMAGFLFNAPNPRYAFVFRWLELMTAGLLPERLRTEFGFEWSASRQRWFERSLELLRKVYPHLPPRLRYVPAYIEAQRRVAGNTNPDRLGRFFTRVALKGLAPRRNRRTAA